MWTLQIKRSHQQIYQLWIETISECPDKIQMFEILLLPKHLLWLPFNFKFENKKNDYHNYYAGWKVFHFHWIFRAIHRDWNTSISIFLLIIYFVEGFCLGC